MDVLYRSGTIVISVLLLMEIAGYSSPVTSTPEAVCGTDEFGSFPITPLVMTSTSCEWKRCLRLSRYK